MGVRGGIGGTAAGTDGIVGMAGVGVGTGAGTPAVMGAARLADTDGEAWDTRATAGSMSTRFITGRRGLRLGMRMADGKFRACAGPMRCGAAGTADESSRPGIGRRRSTAGGRRMGAGATDRGLRDAADRRSEARVEWMADGRRRRVEAGVQARASGAAMGVRQPTGTRRWRGIMAGRAGCEAASAARIAAGRRIASRGEVSAVIAAVRRTAAAPTCLAAVGMHRGASRAVAILAAGIPAISAAMVAAGTRVAGTATAEAVGIIGDFGAHPLSSSNATREGWGTRSLGD